MELICSSQEFKTVHELEAICKHAIKKVLSDFCRKIIMVLVYFL